MDDLDFAWEWYNKNVAYQYDRTGCTLTSLKDGRNAVSIPNGTPFDKVQRYFGIVLTGFISKCDGKQMHGFSYANH